MSTPTLTHTGSITQAHTMGRALRLLALILLLLPLALPQGLAWLGLADEPQAVEKGRKNPLPPLQLAATDFKAFAKALSATYADTFPFRDTLIRTANLLKMDLFGQSPMKTVILGQKGWLFFNDEMDLEDWLNLTDYSQEELDNAVRIFTERGKWLEDQGIAMLVVIAPNKSTVYGEYLPQSYHKLGPSPRLDQLAEAFTRAGIPFLDLRPALLDAKAQRRAYWKTDTHWNDWGALMGCRAMVETLRRRFPAMQPIDPEAFEAREFTSTGGDLSAQMLLEHRITEQFIQMAPRFARTATDGPQPGYPNPATRPGREIIVKVTGDARLPKALFFRDSFSSAAIPFLAEHFSRSVYVWDHRFYPYIVQAEKPDVVVFEAVERYQHALFGEPLPLPSLP